MFLNRRDAALQLALKLESYRGQPVIVLGIARGGAVAVPVCAESNAAALEQEADAVVQKPRLLSAVSHLYKSFDNLSDDETLHFVEKWESERGNRARL